MSWLWNSMSPKISGTCMFFTTTREVYKAIQKDLFKDMRFYSNFQIKVKISTIK